MTGFWTGTRVRLRAAEPGDWTGRRQLTADEERLGDLVQPPRSAEWYRNEARERAGAPPDGDTFGLAVEALDSGELVGGIAVHRADARAGCFEYGITIAAEHRRRGYAAEAVALVLRYMFAERRFHKAEARILAYNEGSLALHRRLGFTEEGRLRDHVYADGRHHELVLVGMLADEFAALHRS